MAEVLAGLEPQGVAGFVGVYNDLHKKRDWVKMTEMGRSTE